MICLGIWNDKMKNIDKLFFFNLQVSKMFVLTFFFSLKCGFASRWEGCLDISLVNVKLHFCTKNSKESRRSNTTQQLHLQIMDFAMIETPMDFEFQTNFVFDPNPSSRFINWKTFNDFLDGMTFGKIEFQQTFEYWGVSIQNEHKLKVFVLKL